MPPSDPRSEIGFSPQGRLQANQVGRTVSGEAEPGTFVQLTQGLNGPVVDEVLVNSSGLYRFEDVPATAYTSARYSDRGYLVQLYIFSLSHQGSEVATYSTASYRPQQRSRSSNRPNLGHELALTYQTFNASNRAQAQAAQLLNGESLSVGLASGRLAIAEWRYRSSRRTLDGQSRWRWSLGYGFSAQRSGPIVSTTIALGTGLDLQMRYQGVSLFDNSKTLQLALVSRLDTQNGLGWGHRRQNELRGRGALKVQPFFDTNTNGVRDEDEALYLDSLELMLSVNHQNIVAYNSELLSDGLLLPLLPDTYRLDIDPAGLPIDKAAIEKSYAVEVVSGQYTTVEVPLASTYTVSGLVIDEAGLAVVGARVEVVSASGHRQQSITNGAGAYYLERLKPEAYELSVNGVLLEESSIVLEENSETFLEKEIRLL